MMTEMIEMVEKTDISVKWRVSYGDGLRLDLQEPK